MVEGKLPLLRNTFACCAGAGSHLASSAASLTFLPCLGRVRYDPPQLPPPPPGIAAMSHFPACSLAWSWIIAIIQEGQPIVAKVPLAKPAFQSGVHASIF